MKWLNGYRMRLVLIGVVAAIFLGGGSANADCIWMPKTDMPTTRYGFSTSVVGAKVYAFAGDSSFRRVDEYDPQTNTWTQKADMPTARHFPSTCVVNEKIFVIGGGSVSMPPVSKVEVYDPTTDNWAEKTELPTQRIWISTSVVDGIIYVIGGQVIGQGELCIMEAYNPSTDTWTRKADMPTRRSFISTCVVDGIIYAIGGWGGSAGLSTVSAYNPQSDTWTRKASMPTARYLLGTCEVGGKIYAIGGWQHSANGPLYSAVEVYDPVTDTWTKEGDIPVPTAGLSTSVEDGKIYAIGGALTTHNGVFIHTSATYAYDIIVDFNGDGIVDCSDMCILVDYWGTDNSLCDIGPMPCGDSIVDVQDLIVLAEHLFEDVYDPTLIAHWPLDEVQGVNAYNNASDRDGTLVNGPVWQPDGGIVAGAIQFDGIDDYVSTDFVLNPADGAFSVIAWIKGEASGQVILSQDGAANWLSTDPSEGKLMTNLSRPPGGRTPPLPLLSEFVITDGNWQRIGFVWDGLCRHLYVDGVEVASDAEPLSGLNDAYGGLYIGTGSNCSAGSFFSGLIDDVRIYNEALSPARIAAIAQ